jgi:Rho GDP-dissociation inhibitor
LFTNFPYATTYVQHEIIAGVKFVNKVSATMMSEEDSLMIGSYPPSSTPFTFEFPKFDYNEAPKGMVNHFSTVY